MDRATKAMEQMRQYELSPNEVTYTAYLKGLCQDSLLNRAVEMVIQMKSEGVVPNTRTLNTLLRGCLRAYSAVAAVNLFFYVTKKLKVEADITSYDYLARTFAQNLQPSQCEAVIKRIEELEMEVPPTVWTALATCKALKGDVTGAFAAVDSGFEALSRKKRLAAQAEEDGEKNETTRASVELFDQLQRQELTKELSRTRSYLWSTIPRRTDKPEGKGEEEQSEQEKRTKAIANAQVKSLIFSPPLAENLFLQSQRVRFLPRDSPIHQHLYEGPSEATKSLLPHKKCPDDLRPQVCLVEQQESGQLDFAAIFGNDKPVRMEVCSGHGDWIAERAQKRAEANWVAIEMRHERVFQIWNRMVFNRLENLLVIGGVATPVFRASVPSQTIQELFVNFPDPPGWTNSKQKLIDSMFLKQAHRILKEDGILTIVTDDRAYAMMMVAELQQHQRRFQSLVGPEGWTGDVPPEYGSSYFDRFWRNGQKTQRFFMQYGRRTFTSKRKAKGGDDEEQSEDGDEPTKQKKVKDTTEEPEGDEQQE